MTGERSDLTCDGARECVSAALDGEASVAEEAAADRHVATCEACAAWHESAATLRRRTRLRADRSDPAFVARVVADARPARLGRGGWMRPVLAWCAVIIAVQSIGPLVFGDADGASAHLSRHLGASGMALALALFYVVWRPHRAFGLLPFVVALFTATFVSMVADMIAGRRSALAEATHVAEFVGTVVLWMMAGSPGIDRLTSRLPHRHSGGEGLPTTR